MPAFGTITTPVRTSQQIEVNSPAGFMTEPPGDLWWIGLSAWWNVWIPAAVTRATSIIVNPLVRIPWIMRTPAGDVAPGDPGYPAWIRDPMLLNGSTGGPNTGRLPMLDRLDRFDVWARWITDALWVGMGVLAFEQDSAGQPLAGTVQVLSPTRVYRGDDGWALDTGGQVQPIGDDGMVGPHRILLLRHSLPGGVFGRHRAQLALANKVTEYASNTFDSGVPSGVLSTDQPLTQTQADVARTEWESRQQRRSVAVLGNGTRYQQVVMSPVDAELAKMSDLTNQQIAHMFELPAWLLDAPTGGSSTYNNGQWYRQDIVDGPLASWSARIEETLGSVLPWTHTLSLDFTRFTTPTTTTTEAPNAAPDPSGN